MTWCKCLCGTDCHRAKISRRWSR